MVQAGKSPAFAERVHKRGILHASLTTPPKPPEDWDFIDVCIVSGSRPVSRRSFPAPTPTSSIRRAEGDALGTEAAPVRVRPARAGQILFHPFKVKSAAPWDRSPGGAAGYPFRPLQGRETTGPAQ